MKLTRIISSARKYGRRLSHSVSIGANFRMTNFWNGNIGRHPNWNFPYSLRLTRNFSSACKYGRPLCMGAIQND